MKLIINGKEEHIVQTALTVSELLKVTSVKMPDMVSVELNGEILRRAEFDTIAIHDNDKIEYMYFMGGGEL
ncbi:MAG: sulfur carrier protein ThiS [Spirochaetes bacterium]|nr:sulfur carrier protein ThiS [Spirochaetota bacterium]